MSVGGSAPLWWDGLPAGATRPALTQDESVDVAIVGAGYTGLWTAYYLLEADPSLKVLVLEAEHVGFGASGRNGGWVSALYPVGPKALARDHGESAARDQYAALRESVDEVGRVAQAEGIECGFHKGGTLVVARNRAQAAGVGRRLRGLRLLGHRHDVARGLGRGRSPCCSRTLGRHLQPALRPHPSVPTRDRARPGRREQGRPDPRAHPGDQVGRTGGW